VPRASVTDRAKEIVRPTYEWTRRRRRHFHSTLLLWRLILRNARTSVPVVGDAPAVVSLTSFGRRIDQVAYAIESIAGGSVRPRRLILWLDEPLSLGDLPPALLRLQSRGLEIRETVDHGPHKKYFPYATSESAHTLPLVTADDDVLYPRSWLAGLLSAYTALPDAVHCYRANVAMAQDGAFLPYTEWPRCTTTRASRAHFATGVSGVLYPPMMLKDLARRGTAFVEAAPTADDIWLHWVALRLGLPVCQVAARPVHFPLIRGSQETSLTAANVQGGGNDRWIRGLYDEGDVLIVTDARHA
jgi:hypothetical protein